LKKLQNGMSDQSRLCLKKLPSIGFDTTDILITDGQARAINPSLHPAACLRSSRSQLYFHCPSGRNQSARARKSGSPIVDEALVRIAALYKIEDSIRGSDPDHRRAVRQDLSLPLVDVFFTWLAAQAKHNVSIRGGPQDLMGLAW
jgi:hypothetical protein